MSRPLPHYPNQRDRDNAAATAGLIVLAVVVVVVGLAIYAVLHLLGLVP